MGKVKPLFYFVQFPIKHIQFAISGSSFGFSFGFDLFFKLFSSCCTFNLSFSTYLDLFRFLALFQGFQFFRFYYP